MHRWRPCRPRYATGLYGDHTEEIIAKAVNNAVTRLKIERLYWRAGFGPRRADLDRLTPVGLAGAIDELLAPAKGPELEPGRGAQVDGKPIDPENSYGHDVLWWLDRSVRARHQLVERMTLNLHDHFATSNAKVGNAKLMMVQYATLRKHSLGNFRTLSLALANDGAMQLWLDMSGSTKGSPNENFARELLELFTLGVNNGYTEKDIREAARAFTGVTYDYDKKSFDFNAQEHDGGMKTVFGKRGRFDAADIINMAIDHPSHAPYLCAKLWGYFSAQPCPPDALKRMVVAYRGSKNELRPVVRIILTHPAIYANLDKPDQVKPPVVYVAGMLRRLGRSVDRESWSWELDEMGQRPFYPPNVSGWEYNESWLSTATIKSRFQAASSLIEKALQDGSVPKTQTPAQAIEAALKATGRPWTSARTKAGLHAYATSSVRGRDEEWEVKHYYTERQRVLRHLLLAGPDAQVS